ncbi:MAG: DMT family transporter [Anaerolineae bacterium]|nr:DMT family transporter [Anaerolineae bacterium]
MKRWQADLTLAWVALIWGSTFVVVKNALDDVGPLTFVGWRFWLAAVFLTLLFFKRMHHLSRDEILAGGLIGVWLSLGYIFQTVGLQTTTSAKAGFITGLSVVIVPVLATLLLRRPPGRGAVGGVAVAVVGLGLLSLNKDLSIQSGDLWVMGCAVAFALHIVTVSIFSPHHDPIRLAVVQIATVGVLATAAAFVFETPALDLPGSTWGAIAFTGVTATALAFGLQVYVQRFTTPTHTVMLFSLEPVFAALFGWWLANEVLGAKELVGCGLILAGMLIAELSSSDETEADQPGERLDHWPAGIEGQAEKC